MGIFYESCFKCAQGKYVCMLSDDCLVVPGAIKNGYELFEKELEKGRKVGAVAFYWRDWSQQQKYHVGYTLGEKMYVNHGMYLNEALKEVNYIDEQTYFFYNGDGDLCLKMWEKGYECISSPDSYIEHYPHANLGVRKSNYKTLKQDNLKYFSKWEGIFYDKKLHNIGKVEEKEFEDKFLTGDKFKNIHDEVVVANPKILKKSKISFVFKKIKLFPRRVAGKLKQRFFN